jgi:PAS domain S-box-containing protein
LAAEADNGGGSGDGALLDRLRRSEERLRLAVEGARLAIWEYDIGDNLLTPTPEIAAVLGLTEQQMADTDFVFSRYHAGDRARVQESGRIALAEGQRHFEAEFRFLGGDDKIRWLMLRAKIVWEGNEARRVVGVIFDISIRKVAEEALRNLTDTLEEQVLTRTQALLDAEEALRQSQKMDAIGQLTGGVAHDFNNLLTVIRASVDLLQRPEITEQKKQRYLAAISETVDRATTLTGQLLAFARRQPLKPETFDVADRLGKLKQMIETLIGPRIRLRFEALCDDCFVEADAAQFETAIVNMALNARDAMDGEGDLTIRLDTTRDVPGGPGHDALTGKYVTVSVIDNGRGIERTALLHVFEPFFTTKPVGKGTGLGLSQVYGFAKQSGGDVRVESAPGEGAHFSLHLPWTEAVTSSSDATAEAESSRAARRVLLVEDNAEVGAFAKGLLEDLGHRATLASNGEDALALLVKNHADFDLVFSDVVMPGMSGIELGQHIRKLYPDLRVVLTSGYSQVLAEQGRHGFELVHKPYSIESLTAALDG